MNETLTREQWLEKRRTGISATDVAKIVGVSPWGGPLDVYLSKRGLVDVQETPAMRLGTALQPVVLNLYEQETGTAVRRYGDTELVICPDLPWALATPDAEQVASRKPVEAKTAGARQVYRWGEAGTDDVPEEYLIQVQWQMMCTGTQAADLAVLLAGQDFRIYHLTRHDALLSSLVEQCARFRHDHLEAVVPPQMDASKGAAEYLRQSFPRDTRPELLAADERLDLTALTLASLRKQRDESETQVVALENVIKADIGSAAGVQGANWRATWKAAKDSRSTDWKGAAAQMQQLLGADGERIVKEFTTTKAGSRRFLFTFNEEE